MNSLRGHAEEEDATKREQSYYFPSCHCGKKTYHISEDTLTMQRSTEKELTSA